MSPLPTLLGAAAPSTALPDQPSLLENLEFQLVGLVIVMGALTMLYLICAALGALFRRAASRAATREAAARTAASRAPTTGKPAAREAGGGHATAPATIARRSDRPPTPLLDGVAESPDGAIPIAVIAAAVAAILDQPHRLVRVVPAPFGWSLEGRRQLLTSHQLRH